MPRPRYSAPKRPNRGAVEEARVVVPVRSLLSCLRFGKMESVDAIKADAKPQLTPATLARHNLKASGQYKLADKACKKFASDEAHRQPEAIATVHKERAAAWRSRVRDAHPTTDEVIEDDVARSPKGLKAHPLL